MSENAEKHKAWSREEHILAFNLYCKIPFGAIHMGNPRVIELAALLGRSAGAVSYKLANFSRLDPELKARGIEGLKHGAKGEVEVWNEFYDDPDSLAFESEQLLANRPVKRLSKLRKSMKSTCRKKGANANKSYVSEWTNASFGTLYLLRITTDVALQA
jgi:hypothetical protein